MTKKKRYERQSGLAGYNQCSDEPVRCAGGFGSQVLRASVIFVQTQAGDLSMAARVSPLSSGAAASRRRERRLRIFWRHEQCSIKMALASAKHHSWQYGASVGVQIDAAPTPVDEYVAPAAAPFAVTADITQLLEPPIPDKFVALVTADTCTERSSVIEYMTPGPAVSYAAPAPEIEHVPDDTNAAPAPVIEHVSFAPVSQVNRNSCGFVNPQFSTARVEVILQEIPEVGVIERAREHIAFAGHIHQKQIVVPTPQFQEQFVESVQKTAGRYPERIEERIENTPIEDV